VITSGFAGPQPNPEYPVIKERKKPSQIAQMKRMPRVIVVSSPDEAFGWDDIAA